MPIWNIYCLGGESFSGCELNRPSVRVSYKKKKTDVYSTQAEVKLGPYEPHKCKNTQKFHSWHKLPKSLQRIQEEKYFNTATGKKKQKTTS